MKKLYFFPRPRKLFLYFCALLTFVLISFGMPATSHAVAQSQVSSWVEFTAAIDSLKETGGIIKFSGNIAMPAGGQKTFDVTEEGRIITIFTNGYTFSVTGSQATFGPGISFSGGDSGSVLRIDNNGTVVFKGASAASPASNTSPVITVKSGGRLKLVSGMIMGYGNGIEVQGGGAAEISGGSISTLGDGKAAVSVSDGGGLEIEGANITANGVMSSCVMVSGAAEIDGDTSISATGDTTRGITVSGTGRLTMDNGNVSSASLGILVYGEFTLNGGMVSSTKTYSLSLQPGSEAEMTGGTISSDSSATRSIYCGSEFRMCDGEIKDIYLGNGAIATILNGEITNTYKPVQFKELPADPTLIYFTAVDWTEQISKASSQTRVYKRASFEVISPASIDLVPDVNRSVEFTIKGQRPIGGSLFKLQDLLGTTGKVSLGGTKYVSYTVSGNRIDFMPQEEGTGELVINDSITCAETVRIPVTVASESEAAVEPEPTPVTEEAELEEAEPEDEIGTSGPSMSQFQKNKTYQPGMFADVNEMLWYGYHQNKVIADAYEYGFMVGNTPTTFNPKGNVTIAEAVTMAARVHSIYETGDAQFPSGSPWYQPYADYAAANDIIKQFDFTDYGRAATRAEMAYILSNALPSEEFRAQNTVNNLPDVDSGTPYSSSIFLLYQAGVLSGNDDTGTFYPGRNISRAEAAAIITRVAVEAKRSSGNTF